MVLRDMKSCNCVNARQFSMFMHAGVCCSNFVLTLFCFSVLPANSQVDKRRRIYLCD